MLVITRGYDRLSIPQGPSFTSSTGSLTFTAWHRHRPPRRRCAERVLDRPVQARHSGTASAGPRHQLQQEPQEPCVGGNACLTEEGRNGKCGMSGKEFESDPTKSNKH